MKYKPGDVAERYLSVDGVWPQFNAIVCQLNKKVVLQNILADPAVQAGSARDTLRNFEAANKDFSNGELAFRELFLTNIRLGDNRATTCKLNVVVLCVLSLARSSH